MNKFYCFSKSKLEFVEIKNLPKKFFFLVTISSFLLSGLIFGGYYLINYIANPNSKIESLKNENRELNEKYRELLALYRNINTELDTLLNNTDLLRAAADLPPVSEDEKIMGTGGGSFSSLLNFDKKNISVNLNEMDNYVDNVKRKLEFEKKNYMDISSKLIENKEFFASLPAIKPASGTIGLHGFGMRLHPILGIRRMHEGIDIITHIGTPVVAAGAGIVDFVGFRGGLGLCVEIDHGFGYRTIYGHLSKLLVKIDQKVKRGQLIAKTGNTGLSSGPHLHYEVQHNGERINPRDFIFDDLKLFDPTTKN
jgi:murein DD-endopeptidase MepM/ murein hydrolase activator NlpD